MSKLWDIERGSYTFKRKWKRKTIMQSMQACRWSVWLLININSKINITFVHNFFIYLLNKDVKYRINGIKI